MNCFVVVVVVVGGRVGEEVGGRDNHMNCPCLINHCSQNVNPSLYLK